MQKRAKQLVGRYYYLLVDAGFRDDLKGFWRDECDPGYANRERKIALLTSKVVPFTASESDARRSYFRDLIDRLRYEGKLVDEILTGYWAGAESDAE